MVAIFELQCNNCGQCNSRSEKENSKLELIKFKKIIF